jgi:gamma-glutamyl-gamma-aminobutyraldehyde dehydrogenase
MLDITHDEWLRRAKALEVSGAHHIDGADEAGGGAAYAVVSPRDGQVLAQVADGGAAEVDAAVAGARRAFDTGPWPRLAPAERGRVLVRIADLLEERRETLALAISLEMGKPITDAYDIELRAAINTFRWYGQLADKLTDESPRTAPDALALVTREPAGVVGAVVPWNFPLTLASWKVAPALAAGCTVVLKPSENSPLSALLLGRIAAEAGLPPGALNVVNGNGPVAGRALGLHPDVDVLAFTGSTAVGRHFLHYAADSNLKRVWLELGGKSPNIILPDAPDLEKAAATAAWGIFFNQGEMCTAPSRLLVHSSIAERVTEAIVRRAQELRVGDPLDPATEMGALVRESHLDRVLDHIRHGVDDGARLRTGGSSAALPATAAPVGVLDLLGHRLALFLGHPVTASWQVHRTVADWPLRRMTTVLKPSQFPHGSLNAGPFLPTSTSRERLAGVWMEKPLVRLRDCCTEIPLYANRGVPARKALDRRSGQRGSGTAIPGPLARSGSTVALFS